MTAYGPRQEEAALSYLRGRALDLAAWEPDALCKQIGQRLFYPEQIEGTIHRESPKAAKAVCGLCPVMPECRALAFVTGEKQGVWGGMSDRERVKALADPDATRQALLDAINGVPPTAGKEPAQVEDAADDTEHPPDTGELKAA